MGREVLNHLPVVLLDACAGRGIDTRELCSCVSRDAAWLRAHPWDRMDWDEFIVLLDHIRDAVGGNEQLEELSRQIVSTSRCMRLAARLLVSTRLPIMLARERVTRRYYHDIGYRVTRQDDGSVRVEYAIPESLRGSVAFGYLCAGGVGAYPRTVGEPFAVLERTITDHDCCFVLRPPPSHVEASRSPELLANWKTLLSSEIDDSPGEPTAEEVQAAINLAFDQSSVAEMASRIGTRLSPALSLAELRAELVAVMKQYFCCRHLTAWVRRGDGQKLEPAVVFGESGPRRLSRPLIVSGREVGRIEVDLDVPEGCESPLFDAILPWVAICLLCAVGGLHGAERVQLERRVEDSGRAWRLTRRESDVLTLLVGGATNKDIALALGTTNRTIEVHVTRLLRKAGADNRATLIARFWSEDPLPSATARV